MTSLPAGFEVATPFLADAANPSYHGGVSLLWGWLPLTIQVVAAVSVLLGIGWRSRRWRGVWLPLAVLVSVAVVGCTYWYVIPEGAGFCQDLGDLGLCLAFGLRVGGIG
jgi:hypothetical protein